LPGALPLPSANRFDGKQDVLRDIDSDAHASYAITSTAWVSGNLTQVSVR